MAEMLQQLFGRRLDVSLSVFLLALCIISCDKKPTIISIYENKYAYLDTIVAVDSKGYFCVNPVYWNIGYPNDSFLAQQYLHNFHTNPTHYLYTTLVSFKKNPFTKYSKFLKNTPSQIPQIEFERLVLLNDFTYFYAATEQDWHVTKGNWEYALNSEKIRFHQASEHLSPDSCDYFQDILTTFDSKNKPNNYGTVYSPQNLSYSLNIDSLKYFCRHDRMGGDFSFNLPITTKFIEFIHPARNLQRTFSVWE